MSDEEIKPPVPRNRNRQPYRFYKPLFLDENRLKMDLDREFESISQAMLQVSEKLSMIDFNIDFDAGEIINDINNIKAQIQINIKRLGNLEEAQSELSFLLDAHYNEMTGSLKHLNRVITNAQKALAESSLQLEVTAGSLTEDNARTRAKITRQDVVISDNTSAIARTEEKLEAVFETVNEEISAQITTIKEAIAKTGEALARVETELTAKIDKQGKELSASIKTTQESVVDTNKAMAQMNTDLTAKITSTNDSLSGKIDDTNKKVTAVEAGVKTNQQAIAKTNEAMASMNTEINAKITVTNKNVTNVESGVKTNQQAIANTDKTIATMKTEVNSKFDEQEALIKNTSTTMFDQKGDGYALHEVKVGVKYKGGEYYAGQWVGASVTGGKVNTEIAFSSDTFRIYNTANKRTEPVFQVTGGVVTLRNASIANASIDSAKIANGAITNAKIGGTLQSDNWPTAGWFLPKNGGMQMKSASTGGRVLLDSTGLAVYDDKNVLRVKVGRL